MPISSALFDATEMSLAALVELVDSGRLQLPEFQRDFVWNLRKRQRLFQSIQKGFPTGTLLLLEVDGEPPFGYRPIQHLAIPPNSSGIEIAPTYLALDGQQRLTSLSHALIRRQASPNDYFLDLRKLHELGKGPESVNLEED